MKLIDISKINFCLENFEINGQRIRENEVDKIKEKEEFILDSPELWELINYARREGEFYSEKNFLLEKYLTNAKWKLEKIRIYGEYSPSEKQINYYKIPTKEEQVIVKIHERFHALHHLTLDDNGEIWINFSCVSSFYLELLAQIFTYKYIEKYQPSLMKAFLDLNKSQPFIYKTWRIFQYSNQQEISDLYWDIRNLRNDRKLTGILGQLNDAYENALKKLSTPKKCSFLRKFDCIDNLINEPLYKNKLFSDIMTTQKGDNVFPAIRNSEIGFYYKGGLLFNYNCSNHQFKTHIKYAAVINNGNKDSYLSETTLKNSSLITDFSVGYDRIKENCKNYSGIEALGVSHLYHKFSYLNTNEEVVVLDIETVFSDSNNKSDRIDILLFNKKEKKLMFVEAKHYSNPELWASSGNCPKVYNQIERYNRIIKNCKNTILSAYREYIDICNKLFNLNLPYPLDIVNETKLYIFGFNNDQKKGKLNPLIANNQWLKEVPIYIRGHQENIDAKTLWHTRNN